MPTIKGTASVADSRARQKALKKTKFPRNFRTPVSLEKVNKPVLTQWIEQKVTSILGFEDEIVSSTAINLFLPSDNASPDPKKAQLDLAGKFCWPSFGETEDCNIPLHGIQGSHYLLLTINRISWRSSGHVFCRTVETYARSTGQYFRNPTNPLGTKKERDDRENGRK